MTYPHTEKETCDICGMAISKGEVVNECIRCKKDCCMVCMPDGKSGTCLTCQLNEDNLDLSDVEEISNGYTKGD